MLPPLSFFHLYGLDHALHAVSRCPLDSPVLTNVMKDITAVAVRLYTNLDLDRNSFFFSLSISAVQVPSLALRAYKRTETHNPWIDRLGRR